MDQTQTWTAAAEDEGELSPQEVAKRALVVIGLLMLVPAGFTILLAIVFMLLPVAVVGIPFMLPVFFPGAASEHEHKREHDALLTHARGAHA